MIKVVFFNLDLREVAEDLDATVGEIIRSLGEVKVVSTDLSTYIETNDHTGSTTPRALFAVTYETG